LQKEEIEKQQTDSQQQMILIQEQMKRQKEEAFRQMAQEKRDRERREQLRREHDASLNRPRQVAPKPVIKQQPVLPPQNYIRPSHQELPFQPENEGEECLLNQFQIHRGTPVDFQLPRVTLIKRNQNYFFGQRRFVPLYQDNTIYVKEGTDYTPFNQWLNKVERVEAIRLKGLKSAQAFLIQSSAFLQQVPS